MRAPASARRNGGAFLRPALRIFAALLIGLVAGVAVILAFLAFRAWVEDAYLHGWNELVGWPAVPAILAPAVLLWAAFRLRDRRFWRTAALLVAALLLGTGSGAGIGALVHPHPGAPWAGGMMGAGAAVIVAAFGSGLYLARTAGRRAAVLALLPFLAPFAGCGPTTEPAPDEPRVIPAPSPEEVTSAVFLLGDPGVARRSTFPVLPRLQSDLERWSRSLGGEGDVVLVVLGDILYPDGLDPLDTDAGAEDLRHLADQIALVGGPAADAAGARVLFVPGNHDWGQEEQVEGSPRLERLDEVLRSWDGEAAGRVSLHPAPGTGGPSVVDVGEHVRLILVDTAWWLLGSDPAEKEAVLEGIRRAMTSAGDRRLVFAAHHPLETGGPHGAGVDLGSFLGIRLLLKRAAILLQDLDSRPYSDLKERLLGLFARLGPPDVFAGGHEHSLQVFSSGTHDHVRGLVLGSASKLTGVTEAPNMLFGRSEPGYGKILVLRDGTLHVRIEAAPARYLHCGESAEPGCMERGVEAYRTVWAENLRPGSPGVQTPPGEQPETRTES